MFIREIGDEQPLLAFNLEKQVNDIITNLLLTISYLCNERPYLALLCQNNGIIRFLCEFFREQEQVKHTVI